MAVHLDIELSEPQVRKMRDIPADAWFTPVTFRNVRPPRHQHAATLNRNNEIKKRLVLPWIQRVVRDKRVLDLFCANGAFSTVAAMAGAREVVGVDFCEDRIRCARFLGEVVSKTARVPVTFRTGDVYKLDQMFDEPFDVVLALGGLYHVPDPPFVLDQIRAMTREHCIVQTASMLRRRGNQAVFRLRRDGSPEGLSSLVGGRGAWKVTVQCFENFLRHARFEILESVRPPFFQRRKFPWYAALTRPV